jgi:MFS family permease
MIFSIVLFFVGSVLCATAQNISWLIGTRVVQGLGGGGIITLGVTIITDITTLRERPKYISMSAFAWALGANIGVS